MNRLKSLEDIVNKYNSIESKNLEFEVRFNFISFQLWENIFEKVFSEYGGSAKIQQSIVANINKSNYILRKESYYNNNTKTYELYVKKTQKFLYTDNISVPYKITISLEEPVETFSINTVNDIRLRYRCSFIKDEWKIEFTYVKQYNNSNDFENIIEYKNKMFKETVEPENYISYVYDNELKNVPITNYEIELEYLNNTKLNIEKVNNIIKYINNIIDPDHKEDNNYNTEFYKVARLLLSDQDEKKNLSNIFKDKYGLKQLATNPFTLIFSNYKEIVLPNINNYYLSDKADGDRCYLYIDKQNTTIFTLFSAIKTNKFDNSSLINKSVIIFDCEIIGLKNEDFKEIYVFDLLMVNNNKITMKTLTERFNELKKLEPDFNDLIKIKPMTKISNTKEIKDFYNRTRFYEVDGLIFTQDITDSIRFNVAENYFDSKIYKWKPPEKQTIDFMVVKTPKQMLNTGVYLEKEGYELYFLFCGIHKDLFNTLNIKYLNNYKEMFSKYRLGNYFPVHFTLESDPLAYLYYHPINFKLGGIIVNKSDLDHHIAEFSYNNKTWVLTRLRKDKDINIYKGTSYGNDYKIAKEIFLTYKHPFTLDMLSEPDKYNIEGSSEYFKTKKKKEYKYATKFNSFVKAQVLAQVSKMNTVVDLASGKGQDIYVYNGYEVKNIIFADVDDAALNLLKNRLLELSNKYMYIYTNKPSKNFNPSVCKINLLNNWQQTYKDLNNVKADAVVINFAIHYLLNDKQALDNLFNLVDSILNKNGLFIFTCFDGEKIVDLIKDTDYEVFENNKLKYKIIKVKPDNKWNLKDFKSSEIGSYVISVLHPFSNGELYNEYVVDINKVINYFINNKYQKIQYESFSNKLNKFKEFNLNYYDNLTNNDKTYCGLYSYVTLWKLP